MKNTVNLLLVLTAVFAPFVHAEQDEKAKINIEKTKSQASQEQGEKVVDTIKANADGCSGTDLLEGHGGIDCSSMNVFDFDDRVPLAEPKK
jgi:hypothetical protein